jgi:hypothetical protein
MHYFIGTRNISDTINTLPLKRHSSLELVRVVLLTEASSTYSSVDVLRRTQYRTPVESLEHTVLCCALFTKPYHSNDEAILLHVCVAMGILLHNNENTCRLVLLRIGYRCSQRVGGFHGRLPHHISALMCNAAALSVSVMFSSET